MENPQTKSRPDAKKKNSGRGNFFQIDAAIWAKVLRYGLNQAIAYLVLASGTGRDNRTTSWSINAIEKYTGISRSAAKRAIEKLRDNGAIEQVQWGSRPSYKLEEIPAHVTPKEKSLGWEKIIGPDWIWLPNSLIKGVGDETPPIERVRRLQDPRVLRLFISLYHLQDLADCGGIHWRQIRKQYEREAITERGKWRIWGFNEKTSGVFQNKQLFKSFHIASEPNADQQSRNDEFWQSWHKLEGLGLLECVPHLVEADCDDAATICPCPDYHHDGGELEMKFGHVLRTSVGIMLGGALSYRTYYHEEVLAVPDGYPSVQMVGIYRLRYRPHTSRTAAWIAGLHESRPWIDELAKIAETGEA